MPVLVQVLGQYIAPVLAQCWTITTSALGQYSLPVLGQYIAPALAQCWTSIGPTLGQYHMPALARFTAAVQRMHWANAVYTGLPVLAQYWPNTLRQHWPNAGPVLAQHWGSTTCQHWPDSQPLCSVCIGPMPFIPACQYLPSTGPILSCLLGGTLGFSPTAGTNFKIERSSWYQIEAYGIGKFSVWKRVYVVHFARLVNINFWQECITRRTIFHHFGDAMAQIMELPSVLSEDAFCQIWCFYVYFWRHGDTIFEYIPNFRPEKRVLAPEGKRPRVGNGHCKLAMAHGIG